jgi:lipopolysaccharide export system protein LptA
VAGCLLPFLLATSLLAQAPKSKEKNTPILLQGANELIGMEIRNEQVNKLIGNVRFQQDNVWLYCDSAYQYEKRNEVECFGNVRLTQGDTVTLTGKKLLYKGNLKKAFFTDQVVLRDRQMTLTTPYLDYDTRSKMASYHGGGKIIDKENVLTSDKGYYNTATKVFWFKKNVVVENKKEQSTLFSDTLEYNSNNGIATFRGPSKVVQKKDILYADHGQYDTRKAQSIFTGRAKVESNNFIMEGDRFFYDETLKAGAASGNVICYSDTNKLIIQGDQVRYWGKEGIVKVYDTPILKNAMGKDTLYLIADTLISIDRPSKKDTSIKEQRVIAYRDAKFWREKTQGVCDSLIYDRKDSVIYFFRKPTLWNDKSQVKADTVLVYLKNKSVHRAECHVNAFSIMQDTVGNFNQVAGKFITAYFKEGKMNQVLVKGNAQTLYFPIDEKKNNEILGMNRADCSSIVVRFSNGKFTSLTYQKKPDARMIPPKEIKEEEKTLEGFDWRSKWRPSFDVFSKRRPPVAIPFIPGKKTAVDTSAIVDTLAKQTTVEAKADEVPATQPPIILAPAKPELETTEPKRKKRGRK